MTWVAFMQDQTALIIPLPGAESLIAKWRERRIWLR
jgi:hypothetical protein